MLFLDFLPVHVPRRTAPEDSCDLLAQMNTISVQCTVQFLYIAPKYAAFMSLYDTKISGPSAAAVHKTSVAAPSFIDVSEEDPLFLASLWLTNMTKMSGWWPNGNKHGSGWRPNGTMSLGWRLHIHMGPRLRMTIKYSDGTKAPDEENIQNQFHLT